MVQKLFSMFPAGIPGVALLLLRLSVAAVLFIDQQGRLFMPAPPWLLLLASLVVIALCVGCITPFSAVAGGAIKLLETACPPGLPAGALASAGIAGCTPMVLISILVAAALAMLGPGAYSLDARMFGRRVVLLPPQR